jgi:hypothetical protein
MFRLEFVGRQTAVRVMLRLLCVTVILAAIACGGGGTPRTSGTAIATSAITFDELCTDCGMHWTVTVDSSVPTNFVIDVQIQNTGERGKLSLDGRKSNLIYFNASQAASWSSQFAAVFALHDPNKTNDLLKTVGPGAVALYPTSQTKLPFILAPGEKWSGRFELRGAVPNDAAAIIFFFQPRTYEKGVNGVASSGEWITVDSTHPYIDLKAR